MNKKTIIIMILAVIFIILVLLGILLYNLNKQTAFGNEQNNIDIVKIAENIHFENTMKTNSEEIKISPNATITFFKHYKTCGHTIKSKEFASDDMVNISQDEFFSLYSDWKINKFTSKEIELYKEFEGSCGEHYLVKSVDGFISIFNIKGETSETELLRTTDISVKYLANEDVNELENGIILYGKDNLNAYIENFE